MRRWSPVFLLIVAGACARPEPSTAPVRLVDVFQQATVEGTPPAESVSYPRTEWLFTEGSGSEWRAAQGISDLRVEAGVLRGRSGSSQPVLVARGPGDVPPSELLHAVEIRARASAGTRMTLRFYPGDALDLSRALARPVGAAQTPILAADEMRTYLLSPVGEYRAADIGHVLLIPTNVADAEFEVQSVRLVFRGEHLRSIPSGVGWHGMSEIYRESIVTRSPEVVRFDVVLPAEPALELAVGTVEEAPVTFRVDIKAANVEHTTTFRTIVTEPDRWQSMWLDLDGLKGRAEVALSLVAERPDTLGFWGAPAIRSAAALGDETPRGVILIITDTLRSDHLSLYGYDRETAPTLARLGREGVLFSDVISQASWTKVSVPSIQTSLYPATHTVSEIPDRLPASATTIAEVYRKAGYATLALTRSPFVGQFSNLHQGYEVLHETGSVPPGSSRLASHAYVGRLLSWLEEHRDTRFFALLHVTDPHGPFRPAQGYETAFAKPGDMDRLDALIEKVEPHMDARGRNFSAPRREELVAAGIDPEEFVNHEWNGYDGKIRGMDDAFETLVEGLEAYGLSDRTLVAVVADHGTEFLEHGAHSHGHTVYGELNRVPMLLWGPGHVPAGRKVDATVQTIDLMPTLLELSGLPTPENVQGKSLRPLFSDDDVGWNRPAITDLPARYTWGEQPRMTALISEGWKLVRIDDPSGARYQLYDYRKDPMDLHDLSGEHPDVVNKLSEQIERFREFAAAARLDDAKAPEQMDSAELERLRSLGYVQ